jgi:hypothetical protein
MPSCTNSNPPPSPPPLPPWTVPRAQAALEDAASQIVSAISLLDEVWDGLPRPDDIEDREEHRLPDDQATDILATIECVLADDLRPAVKALRRSARISDARRQGGEVIGFPKP